MENKKENFENSEKKSKIAELNTKCYETEITKCVGKCEVVEKEK